ncbi:MAG: hypothetical protein JSV86_01715 [Gemmatimonadota bacterium]|nr:MAG: hypothetical protein JSV86_01715 [Gemmatimonadota bacterium]
MRQEIRTALAAGALFVAATAACERPEREPPAKGEQPPAAELERAGAYAIGGGVLYRRVGGSYVPLAVLPGAGRQAPDTLEECATDIPDLGETRFEELDLATDTAWAAWVTSGPGACVGVVGLGDPAVRVLGRWTEAVPETVLWAPAGRYLAIWLARAAGRRSLEVFDALAGGRLAMPWETECDYAEDCDVAVAVWLGGTLLDVEIRLGPAELSVPFEVNVAAEALVGPEEEI